MGVLLQQSPIDWTYQAVFKKIKKLKELHFYPSQHLNKIYTVVSAISLMKNEEVHQELRKFERHSGTRGLKGLFLPLCVQVRIHVWHKPKHFGKGQGCVKRQLSCCHGQMCCCYLLTLTNSSCEELATFGTNPWFFPHSCSQPGEQSTVKQKQECKQPLEGPMIPYGWAEPSHSIGKERGRLSKGSTQTKCGCTHRNRADAVL